MGEAKRAGLIEAGWQEVLDHGLVDDSPDELRLLRAVFMAGATHAVGLIAEILAATPESGELTEAQAAAMKGIIDECLDHTKRASQGDFEP